MDEKPMESRSGSKDKMTDEPRRSRSREKFHDTQKQVYVRGLDRDTKDRDLEEAFGKFGRVLSVDIKHNRYAFIDFDTEEAALKAVESMDGKKFINGEVLNVQRSSKYSFHD